MDNSVIYEELDYSIIENKLSLLGKRERKIVMERFGLFNGSQKTYKELSELFGLHPSYIAQIVGNALAKMRLGKKSKAT